VSVRADLPRGKDRVPADMRTRVHEHVARTKQAARRVGFGVLVGVAEHDPLRPVGQVKPHLAAVWVARRPLTAWDRKDPPVPCCGNDAAEWVRAGERREHAADVSPVLVAGERWDPVPVGNNPASGNLRGQLLAALFQSPPLSPCRADS
jgi:hypothetical protein